MDIDFLIVGQGLAGSLLGFELLQRGCKVVIVDNGQESASQVAAGLINPITGMRLVKCQDVDNLLPAAKSCYAQFATLFRQVFYIEKTMLRIFRNSDERCYALKRSVMPEYSPYFTYPVNESLAMGGMRTPLGYVEQKQTGYLLTRPLLNCLKSFFMANNSYCHNHFDYSDVQLEPWLKWQQFQPKTIVFCEGYQAIRNPWFSWLPFQPVKGEILTLRHQAAVPDRIFNYSHWLIPLDAQTIRVGATFDRENMDLTPTTRAKYNLLDELKVLSTSLSSVNLISQAVHIRPCTLDKQPYIGHHPHYKQLAIFNGFGAKGSLYIPLCSRIFADHLLQGSFLPYSVNRHYGTHFSG